MLICDHCMTFRNGLSSSLCPDCKEDLRVCVFDNMHSSDILIVMSRYLFVPDIDVLLCLVNDCKLRKLS